VAVKQSAKGLFERGMQYEQKTANNMNLHLSTEAERRGRARSEGIMKGKKVLRVRWKVNLDFEL